MKKLFVTLGLAFITAVGFSQSTSYTIGGCFAGGAFFKLNGTIQVNDSTVTITTNRTWNYNVVPSTTGEIYITDGIQTGKLIISSPPSRKKIKGFVPTHDIVHILDANNPLHSTIYYVR